MKIHGVKDHPLLLYSIRTAAMYTDQNKVNTSSKGPSPNRLNSIITVHGFQGS